MRASAFDPPEIPPSFWQRTDVRRALSRRDMGVLFDVLNHTLGLSQIRIGTAVEISQGRIGEVIRGTRRIAGLHVFQRIADGLDMPNDCRTLLGVSPHQEQPGERPNVAAPAPLSVKLL
jgi:predicted XRE-type DNA-binding protein